MPANIIGHLSFHIKTLLLSAMKEEDSEVCKPQTLTGEMEKEFLAQIHHFQNRFHIELITEIIGLKQQMETMGSKAEGATQRAIAIKKRQWKNEIDILNQWKALIQNPQNNLLLHPADASSTQKQKMDMVQILLEDLCHLFSNDEKLPEWIKKKLSEWDKTFEKMELDEDKKQKLQLYFQAKNPGPKLRFQVPANNSPQEEKPKRQVSESEILNFFHSLWKNNYFPDAANLQEVYMIVCKTFGFNEKTAASKVSQYQNTKKANEEMPWPYGVQNEN